VANRGKYASLGRKGRFCGGKGTRRGGPSPGISPIGLSLILGERRGERRLLDGRGRVLIQGEKGRPAHYAK